MCGIVAILSQGEPVSAELLCRATRRLDHRGPDLQRQWVSPDGRVGLGHARLSIIDLATGEQPIASEDGSLRIVANGEFYGYEAIRRALLQRGHQLATCADTEVALHLYEEMGAECLSHLRGEFAFVLWDAARGTLFAARDRFGIKPLFYAVVGDTLYLASEAKALFAAGVPAGWDREAVFQQLFLCTAQDRTLFAGVWQVPPGHYLEARAGGLRVVRYWDLCYPRGERPAGVRREAELVEELRQTLAEAVRLRMRADVPVGCLLSGGVDSSAVLGMAARDHAGPIRAFTVTFDHPAYDEGPIARETVDRVGGEYYPIALDQDLLAEHLADAVWHGETLGANALGVARYLQSRAVHQAGYKVVLSGDGADELFAGYLYFRHEYLVRARDGLDEGLRQQLLAALLRDNPAFRAVLSQPRTASAGVQRLLGFVPSWLRATAVSRGDLAALLAPDFAAEFAARDLQAAFVERFDITGQLTGRDPVLQALYLWTKSMLPNQVLIADRLDMAHAVEVRMPLLDHRVAELVREMPVSLLIRGLTEKYALRQAVRSYVSDRVYRRPKHPFTAPHGTLDTNSGLHQLTQDVLRGPALAALPFFDRRAVVALLDRLPGLDHRQRIALDPCFFLILCACILQLRYGLGSRR